MTFKVFADGDTLTAADVNLLIRQGISVVTSATRPASPTVGQFIYETDTGFTRRWSGTAWVLWPDTPQQVFDATNLATSGTTFLAGTPNLSISFTAPSSGKAMVSVAGNIEGGAGGGSCVLTFEVRVTNVSGTVIVAAADENGLLVQGQNNVQAANRIIVTGLTAGGTYFVRTMHHSTLAGDNVNVFNRRLTVEPLPN